MPVAPARPEVNAAAPVAPESVPVAQPYVTEPQRGGRAAPYPGVTGQPRSLGEQELLYRLDQMQKLAVHDRTYERTRYRSLRRKLDDAREEISELQANASAGKVREQGEQIAQFERQCAELTDQLRRTQEELEQAKAEQEGFLATVAGKPADGSVSKKPDLHKYILKPSQFDGESKEVKVLDWVIVVQLYLTTMEVDLHLWVTTASSYLRGEALRFWVGRLQSLSEDEKEDWLTFREALVERFDVENTAVSARLKLDALQQGDLSMPRFVHKFDLIASYLNDISEADLIHRFLEAVREDLKVSLSNNPVTGERWTEYAKLRRFALNMYPAGCRPPSSRSKGQGHSEKKSLRSRLTFPSGSRAAVAEDVAKVKGRLDRRLKVNGGVKKGPVAPTHEARTFKNAEGVKVHRSQDDVAACWKHRLCSFCYQRGHNSNECQERHPARGSPPV